MQAGYKTWKTAGFCVSKFGNSKLMSISTSASLLAATLACLAAAVAFASEPKTDFFEELTFSGCYADTRQRPTLEGRKETDAATMSRTKCFNACAKRRYKMFGLKSGSECHCGNNLLHSTLAQAGRCSLPCAGDQAQQCGGESEMAVYKIGDVKIFDKMSTEVSAAAFYGCYRDDTRQSILLDVIERKDVAMSSGMCRRICSEKKSKLYGLKAGNLCYCGSGLREDAVTEAGMCDSPCTGNPAERCGGKSHTEIYQILRIGNFKLPNPHSDEL